LLKLDTATAVDVLDGNLREIDNRSISLGERFLVQAKSVA